MEVNKSEAERCRDIGAAALRTGDHARAVKFLSKSLQLYPLPGVEALLGHAKSQMNGAANRTSSSASTSNGTSSSSSPAAPSPAAAAPSPAAAAANSSRNVTQQSTGSDGRAYSNEQVAIVKKVLRSKEGGRGAHYRVLDLSENATEADIKKAYRKLSLKVHPDKNSAPHSDEAFKAVGLAYATLSDPHKRQIYDRYGEEDPDNRGGGMRPAGGMNMRHGGQEMSPEEIFNMFFGGGMPMNAGAGGNGFHFYSTGFGPGMQFRGGVPQQQRQRQRARQPGARQQQEEPGSNGLSLLLQLLPLLLIAFLSFSRSTEEGMAGMAMPGENKFFSLTRKKPFINQLSTRLTEVKDIPYYVTDRFLQTYSRNRYQLSQVEVMVERAYEQYLVNECKTQVNYKRKLESDASQMETEADRLRQLDIAKSFELNRCIELDELFPKRKEKNRKS